jgi:hypothetical protein
MKIEIKKSFILFGVLTLLLAAIFFLFPINLFDGEIVYQNGLQELTVERPLSLSYFIGIGFDEEDMIGVLDYYLTYKGVMMAFIFIIGFPALFAYRMYLRATKNQDK